MPVLRIGKEVGQPNFSICFDLARDLESFRNLTDAQLQNLVLSSLKPLRKIKANAAPMMNAIEDVPVHSLRGLSHDDVATRAADIQCDGALIARLLGAYEATKKSNAKSPARKRGMIVATAHATAFIHLSLPPPFAIIRL